jgi:hypothetical protein
VIAYSKTAGTTTTIEISLNQGLTTPFSFEIAGLLTATAPTITL